MDIAGKWEDDGRDIHRPLKASFTVRHCVRNRKETAKTMFHSAVNLNLYQKSINTGTVADQKTYCFFEEIKITFRLFFFFF